MSRLLTLPVFLILLLSASGLALLACGGGNSRTLQSVSINPAAAVSPAHFTATGIYNQAPMSVDVTNTVTWCVGTTDGFCGGSIAIGASVNAGYARCLSGFPGPVTILAGQAGNMQGPYASPPLKPFASAQLTCP
jgi:hypothetical protein